MELVSVAVNQTQTIQHAMNILYCVAKLWGFNFIYYIHTIKQLEDDSYCACANKAFSQLEQ